MVSDRMEYTLTKSSVVMVSEPHFEAETDRFRYRVYNGNVSIQHKNTPTMRVEEVPLGDLVDLHVKWLAMMEEYEELAEGVGL